MWTRASCCCLSVRLPVLNPLVTFHPHLHPSSFFPMHRCVLVPRGGAIKGGRDSIWSKEEIEFATAPANSEQAPTSPSSGSSWSMMKRMLFNDIGYLLIKAIISQIEKSSAGLYSLVVVNSTGEVWHYFRINVAGDWHDATWPTWCWWSLLLYCYHAEWNDACRVWFWAESSVHLVLPWGHLHSGGRGRECGPGDLLKNFPQTDNVNEKLFLPVELGWCARAEAWLVEGRRRIVG